MTRAPTPRHILITGGSSGIGRALALEYAAPGVRLTLTGRDPARLDDAVDACRAKGAEAEGRIVDVADRDAMEAFVLETDAVRPLDLVVANAGISAGTASGGQGGLMGESAEQTRRIMAVNVDGVMNTVLPLIPRFRERRAGQIALVSSMAAFRGFPGAPAYCASKAAVKTWGEALRGWLGPEGVRVSVICPGFVESRITAANDFPMPFFMSGEKAARIIRRKLARDRGRIAFPLPTYMGSWLAGALPDGLVDAITRRMPAKGG
ncbi:Oxidoreductase [Caenispirillum salinarum AK4]|uniref:Oxidoreductase n=1 Tax=Caenispirillum salinarum AK4 TaxID=1238182 RepID=K9GY52_9PROT|nr:SDR family NAD(P)-dependent oxidoreductase [Caenispirillum salinarum]EKV30167.1 Oxidoreductase [Caenispirillum salinarum AK4]